MTARTVNAEVVLAALDLIEAVLSDLTHRQATRISVARRRVVTLRHEIENQADEPTSSSQRGAEPTYFGEGADREPRLRRGYLVRTDRESAREAMASLGDPLDPMPDVWIVEVED